MSKIKTGDHVTIDNKSTPMDELKNLEDVSMGKIYEVLLTGDNVRIISFVDDSGGQPWKDSKYFRKVNGVKLRKNTGGYCESTKNKFNAGDEVTLTEENYASRGLSFRNTKYFVREIDVHGNYGISEGREGAIEYYVFEKDMNLICKASHEDISKEYIRDHKSVDYFKAKSDQGKLRFDLIPPVWEEILAQILTGAPNGLGGAAEYGENTWFTVEDAIKRYTAAGGRHRNKYRQGIFYDKKTGLPHMGLAAWNDLAVMTLEGIARIKGYDHKVNIEDIYSLSVDDIIRKSEVKENA